MPNLLSIWSKSRSCLGLAILLLCAGFCTAAHAEGRDVVEFGNDIVVHEGEETHDTVCFLCSIEVDGTVHGDMVAFLGNIHVRGHAERDAVVFLGNITLADNASIDRDVVVFAGSLHNAPGVLDRQRSGRLSGVPALSAASGLRWNHLPDRLGDPGAGLS